MKKILIYLALALTASFAFADIQTELEVLASRLTPLTTGVNTRDEYKHLADSLLKTSPKNIDYLFLNISANGMYPLDTMELIAATELALKNIPLKKKTLHTASLYMNAAATAMVDSVAAFDILKRAWKREPWANCFDLMASLCLRFNDSTTLKSAIKDMTGNKNVNAGSITAANLIMDALRGNDIALYDKTLNLVDTYPVYPAFMVAYDVLQHSAPERLPEAVCQMASNYEVPQEYADYYAKHRKEVDAEFAKKLSETAEDNKWMVEEGRIGLLYLLEQYREVWDILKNMEAAGVGDKDLMQGRLADIASKLKYSFEIIRYTDDTPMQELNDDFATSRLIALMDTRQTDETIALAQYLMHKQPDTAFAAYFAIGMAELNAEEWGKAAEAFETASIYNDNEGIIQFYNAVALQHIGRNDDAKAILEELLSDDNDTMTFWDNDTMKGMAAAALGKKDEALKYADKLANDPDTDWYEYNEPAWIYYMCNETDKGAEALKKAMEIYPRALEAITVSPIWDDFRDEISNLSTEQTH